IRATQRATKPDGRNTQPRATHSRRLGRWCSAVRAQAAVSAPTPTRRSHAREQQDPEPGRADIGHVVGHAATLLLGRGILDGRRGFLATFATGLFFLFLFLVLRVLLLGLFLFAFGLFFLALGLAPGVD